MMTVRISLERPEAEWPTIKLWLNSKDELLRFQARMVRRGRSRSISLTFKIEND